MTQPVLQVIVGSTRPGRAGKAIADWFVDRARGHGGFDVEVVDLAEVDLPLLDEPEHPRLQHYTHEHTKRWSEIVSRGDAFVMVTPEYNHSFPATLKNALDYLHVEWAHKPVGFVSYGGVSGGTRAVLGLKQVAATLRMVPVVDAVNVPFFTQFVRDGRFLPNDVTDDAADTMLDELRDYADALQLVRSRRGREAGRAA
jgi:NAD(P)H-dependent FMN reductase